MITLLRWLQHLYRLLLLMLLQLLLLLLLGSKMAHFLCFCRSLALLDRR